MIATIGKMYTFEAAHWLPNHEGKCRRLHGHSYKVEVSVKGQIVETVGEPNEGMVVDFGVLDQIVKPIIEKLDHSCINDLFDEVTTTAENIAGYIHDIIFRDLAGDLVLRVRVWETEKSWAEVSDED